jgi:hypothetical protein
MFDHLQRFVILKQTFAQIIHVETDRDRDIGAQCATNRDRDRVDQGTVDQAVPAMLHRREKARDCVGGADRLDQISLTKPDLMAGLRSLRLRPAGSRIGATFALW